MSIKTHATPMSQSEYQYHLGLCADTAKQCELHRYLYGKGHAALCSPCLSAEDPSHAARAAAEAVGGVQQEPL